MTTTRPCTYSVELDGTRHYCVGYVPHDNHTLRAPAAVRLATPHGEEGATLHNLRPIGLEREGWDTPPEAA